MTLKNSSPILDFSNLKAKSDTEQQTKEKDNSKTFWLMKNLIEIVEKEFKE